MGLFSKKKILFQVLLTFLATVSAILIYKFTIGRSGNNPPENTKSQIEDNSINISDSANVKTFNKAEIFQKSDSGKNKANIIQGDNNKIDLSEKNYYSNGQKKGTNKDDNPLYYQPLNSREPEPGIFPWEKEYFISEFSDPPDPDLQYENLDVTYDDKKKLDSYLDNTFIKEIHIFYFPQIRESKRYSIQIRNYLLNEGFDNCYLIGRDHKFTEGRFTIKTSPVKDWTQKNAGTGIIAIYTSIE